MNNLLLDNTIGKSTWVGIPCEVDLYSARRSCNRWPRAVRLRDQLSECQFCLEARPIFIILIIVVLRSYSISYLFDRINEFCYQLAHPAPVDFRPKHSPNFDHFAFVEVADKIAGLAIGHFHLYLNLSHVLRRNVIVLAKVWTFNFEDDFLLQLVIAFYNAVWSGTNACVLGVKNKPDWLDNIACDVLHELVS